MFFPYNLMFHTCCVIFRLGYSICVLSRQKCACASIFSRYMFFFVARIARTPSLFFVNIMKDNKNAQLRESITMNTLVYGLIS